MDQSLILQLLQGSIDQSQSIRDQSQSQLDQHFSNLNNMKILFELIINQNQLAEIYFNYWIQNKYETLNTQQQYELNINLIQIYELQKTKSELFNKAFKIILIKKKEENILFQWILQTTDLDLLYYIAKQIYNEEGDSERVKQLCQNGLSKINSLSEKGLKLLILSQKVIKQNEQDILQFDYFLKQLQQTFESNNIQNAKMAYLIQKLLLNKLTYNNNISLNQMILLLNILDEYYFSNPLLQQFSIQYESQQQFQNELLKIKDNPNFQNKLILQVLKILKLLLQNHTYDPLLVLEQINKNGLEFEMILFEGYFNKILHFLTRYALLLSPQQIYDIFYDSEEAFAENNNAAYEIRDTAIDFLLASLQSNKADEVANTITNNFSYAPQLNSLDNLIQKEAIYFLIRNVMLDMQFDMDLYIEQFTQELKVNDPLYDPLKIQILQIFIRYLKHHDSIPQDIFTQIINLIMQLQSKNLCIILLQVECLGQLIELLENPGQYWPNIQNLYDQFKKEESKVCLLNFYIQLTKKQQFTDHSWMLQKFNQEWQINDLSLQEKILESLLEIIYRTDNIGQHLEISLILIKQAFLNSQLILIETATEIILQLLSQCNQQKLNLSKEIIFYIQNILYNQLISENEFWIQSILIQVYILYTKQYNEQLMQETLLQQVKKIKDIKEEPYQLVFIPLFIYVQLNQSQEFSKHIFDFLIQQQLSHQLFIKLGNLIALTSNMTLSDNINSQILQAYLSNNELELEYFKNFIILLERSQSQFLMHCQEIYQNKCQTTLESNKNYIINELRPLLGDRRLRMPIL